MPWYVAKSGSCPVEKPWAVIKEGSNELVACHPSQDSADQQLKVLDVSTPDVYPDGTRSAAPEPPHLRESDDDERCATCHMFDNGLCWGYGNHPVSPDQVCDSWSPETGKRGDSLSQVSVISEPRTYVPDSSYSFFRDQQRALALGDRPALERLRRHLVEVSHEVDSGTAEGRRVLRELGEELRDNDEIRSRPERDRVVREDLGRRSAAAEFRAATTTSITGFVTPQWIVEQYALFRSTQRTYVDQTTILPIPGFGMTIHVPRFTSAASAGVQAEGGAVIELDPTGADNAENVQTIAGQFTASQQVIDRTRGMPDGPSFDLVLYKQLKDAYDQSFNNYVLGKVMGAGVQVAGAVTWTDLSTFWTDLSLAREKLTDTSGVHLMPTHLFMHPDLYGYLTKQVDSSKRPLIVPQFFPGEPVFASEDHHPGWDQFTGTVAPGVLMWFVDQTIPFAGANNQWLVSRPETVLAWEGEPVTRSFVETVANQLQVVVQLYGYTCCIPRFPGATAVVTGNAYPSTDV